MMSSSFYGLESNREVIRVHVKKCEGLMQPEYKKFSIDPQITSFEMLQNLLAKAFDIKSDFSISYLSQDGNQDVYLTMLSDWDMDAAFQNASDPCLKLKVDLRPFDEALEDWDIIAPVEIPQYKMAFLDRGTFLGNITGQISNRVEKLSSTMQKAMGMKTEDEAQYRPIKSPMTDMEFRNYLDSDGHMVKPSEFRLSIYQGGTEPSLRRVVWRHLLNIYPESMSGRERFAYMKKKENEYFELRDQWKKLQAGQQLSEDVKHVMGLVKKDVLRTDRTHKYYAGGDESKNLVALYNFLVTYALTHPEVSYCQGMSDIASPLLVVQKEEAQAYLCFCGLMKRLRTNFMYDGEAITTKLRHLSSLMHFYDPVYHSYLKEHGADDLFFCYRWLLLEMKREFPFDDALYMLEVMWSTLPPSPPDAELQLTDGDYCQAHLLSVSPNSPSFSVKTQYSRLLAKRRLSNVIREHPVARSPKPVSSPNVNSVLHDNYTAGDCTETIAEEDSNKLEKTVGNESQCSTETIEVKNPEKVTNNGDSDLTNCALEKSLHSNSVQSISSANHHVHDYSGDCSDPTHSSSSEGLSNDSTNISSDAINSSNSADVSNDSSSVDISPCYDTNYSSSSHLSNDNLGHGRCLTNENTSEYHSAPVSIATSSPQCISVGSTSSSYLSSCSQLTERFPSLISASVDEDTEVISSSEVKTVTDDSIQNPHYSPKNGAGKSDQTYESLSKNYRSDAFTHDENENQAQFHLSLEEQEPSHETATKPAVPQIKGSFFSGMKKILMSPKRRPGHAQQVSPNPNLAIKKNQVPKSTSLGNMSTKNHVNSSESNSETDSEHTLFEVNRMIKSINIDTRDFDETDSGNGSITSVHSGKIQGTQRGCQIPSNMTKSVDMLSKDDKQYFNQNYHEMMSAGHSKGASSTPDEKQPSFCENHFSIDTNENGRIDEAKDASDDKISDCVEVKEAMEMEISRFKLLPKPDEFGYGNPFLMFTCLTVLLQHREVVVGTGMEYDELAMYFDKMVRKHKVHKVLHQARLLYSEYIRMQQKIQMDSMMEGDDEKAGFSV